MHTLYSEIGLSYQPNLDIASHLFQLCACDYQIRYNHDMKLGTGMEQNCAWHYKVLHSTIMGKYVYMRVVESSTVFGKHKQNHWEGLRAVNDEN